MAVIIICLILIAYIFLPWFVSLDSLSAGDWPHLFIENIQEFSFLPEARNLWLAPYNQILTKIVVQYGTLPWEIAERLLWFLPFIILSVVASYRAFRSWVSVLIYSTNTYILMIVGGGQMGVAMAYALAPWTFTRPSFFSIAIQAMFDPRIAFLTLVASIFVIRPNLKRLLIQLLGVLIIHLYWIIPMLRTPSVIGERLSQVSTGILQFLSFATFSQTISLLHPNWPENIFGKVYFMQPEFLLIPIIAFWVFLFGDPKTKRTAFSYGLLAIVGAFLAKGTQEPFGGIYQWLFESVPGFWLFRDSTKFYLWIVLAFAYLIPKSRIPPVLIIILWTLLIRQALTHDLGGTFRPQPIEAEYLKVKELIKDLPDGAQTFWYPSVSRFAFYSTEHPAVPLSQPPATGSGSLVIVPWDSRGEIFVSERRYDDGVRLETIASISAIPFLERIPNFTKLSVWKIK